MAEEKAAKKDVERRMVMPKLQPKRKSKKDKKSSPAECSYGATCETAKAGYEQRMPGSI